MSKETEKAIGGPMRRLVHCCRRLGFQLGYRYWKLQNKAEKDPELVIIWCEAWEAGAREAEARGEYLFAGCLRGMVRECEEIRRKRCAVNVKGHGRAQMK